VCRAPWERVARRGLAQRGACRAAAAGAPPLHALPAARRAFEQLPRVHCAALRRAAGVLYPAARCLERSGQDGRALEVLVATDGPLAPYVALVRAQALRDMLSTMKEQAAAAERTSDAAKHLRNALEEGSLCKRQLRLHLLNSRANVHQRILEGTGGGKT
jgi:hypothetical protein